MSYWPFQGGSFVVVLLCASVVVYVKLVPVLFIPHPSFFWFLRRAVHPDCGIFWVSPDCGIFWVSSGYLWFEVIFGNEL